MGVLTQYEPKDVFCYFETICSIPHGSGKTDRIVAYLKQFAADRGLACECDKANNVIIRKAASLGYEKADVLILQGHHDMVCEKGEGVAFDFVHQPIVPVVDGDWIRAAGTTLGGDNGIGVAMILAILDNDALPHPPLEVLITADEEIGMLGAFALDCSHLVGHKLINLDSEYEGVLMCSCAGGVNVRSTIPVSRETVTGQIVELSIKGLTSGHSGVEIDKGRANANVLMARLLHELAASCSYRIVTLEGGSRETAIAAAVEATLLVDATQTKALCALVEKLGTEFQKEYVASEPHMEIRATEGEVDTVSAVTKTDTALLHTVLVAIPDGVQVMSLEMPGLVQTSTNFGTLKLTKEALTFSNTIRSSVTPQKEWITERIASIVKLGGGTVKTDGNYPGWAYNPNSVIKDTILAAYKKLFGKEASVEAVHAGIECGLFADSISGLDCVSIGPDMADVHTPREHLSISSTARTYKLLKKVLALSK